jgi:glycosyltransferase involved in cell wall biosynthesis
MSCRLLYLVGQLGTGGLEQQLCYLLEAMDRERNRPAVAVWNLHQADIRHLSRIRALGIPLYPCNEGLSRISKLRWLRRLVKGLEPEVVHSYSFFTNFAVWWATLGSKAIPVGSIRNNFLIERRLYGTVLGRLSARLPVVQLCNSVAAKIIVERVSGPFKPSRLHVVRNRLDIDLFRHDPSLPSKPTLLAIGTLDQRKRWDRLLKVTALAAARDLKFSVRLAGDGPLLEELTAEATHLGIDGIIEFLGRRHDTTALLADSTILIHTADEEGCPNVVMEAMACGRAVVATDAGDVPYLVEDGKTGFVVKRGDDAALLDRVERLILCPDLCRRMGEAGRAKAEREFGKHWLVDETLDVYRTAGWRES